MPHIAYNSKQQFALSKQIRKIILISNWLWYFQIFINIEVLADSRFNYLVSVLIWNLIVKTTDD